MDIFGVQVMCFVLDWTGRLGLTFTTGLLIRFAAKRKMAEAICSGAAISFLPSF